MSPGKAATPEPNRTCSEMEACSFVWSLFGALFLKRNCQTAISPGQGQLCPEKSSWPEKATPDACREVWGPNLQEKQAAGVVALTHVEPQWAQRSDISGRRIESPALWWFFVTNFKMHCLPFWFMLARSGRPLSTLLPPVLYQLNRLACPRETVAHSFPILRSAIVHGLQWQKIVLEILDNSWRHCTPVPHAGSYYYDCECSICHCHIISGHDHDLNKVTTTWEMKNCFDTSMETTLVSAVEQLMQRGDPNFLTGRGWYLLPTHESKNVHGIFLSSLQQKTSKRERTSKANQGQCFGSMRMAGVGSRSLSVSLACRQDPGVVCVYGASLKLLAPQLLSFNCSSLVALTAGEASHCLWQKRKESVRMSRTVSTWCAKCS